MKKITLILTLVFLSFLSISSRAATPLNEPPAWAKKAIWYQIMVERFRNGDTSNDPTPEDMDVPDMNIITPKGWHITSWTQDWYKLDDWEKQSGKSFNDILQYRRYGGDIQGIIDKLSYLKELGVNAIFLNPINDAPSLHKYDARNYHHVDIHFGNDPEGDKKLIASENPADPATWKWTSADLLFLQLVEKAHQLGMKIILDYSWNHTGTRFWAWQDILKNQSASPFRDWYNITSFDDPKTPGNEFSYEGWYGNKYMPELKKTDIKTPRVNGLPYDGNINDGAKQHIFAVAKRWLAPNGDTSKGIDGFRLDVAEQIGFGFWRDFRKMVRSVQPEAYLIGEIWWEKWPDKLMDPAPYCHGDMFDAVMYYQVYKPARYFFAATKTPIDARQLKDSLETEWNKLNKANLYAMMNVSSTHDAPRLLTDFYNTNRYKFHANPNEDPDYKTGKPDKETYQRLRLYLVHLFTTVGAPQIWNGEEMGMWGSDDPNCRKPLWWKELTFEPERRNNIQPGPSEYDPTGFNESQFKLYKLLTSIRESNPALNDGILKFIYTKDKKLIYERSDKSEKIYVLFNADTKQAGFTVPDPGKYIDLLTGGIVPGRHVWLRPLSAMILKKI